jgi:CheY-like chemotaxis protein
MAARRRTSAPTGTSTQGDFITLLNRIVVGVLALGSLAAIVVGAGAGQWTDGLRWSLYMIASFAVAAIFGLIFGVPRARTDFSADATERYSSNSNLEQISDWLTKLLVGAGLVELKSLPALAVSAGAYLGTGMAVSNASAYSVSAVVYGAGVGFIAAYLWTRLRLRYLLESSDRSAAEASKQADKIVVALRNAGAASAAPESERDLRLAAETAVSSSKSLSLAKPAKPVLWVDDQPANNGSLVGALEAAGIPVDHALSTTEAMDRLQLKKYGLVITDLGRRESGHIHQTAGRTLIEAMRKSDNLTPVLVFAGDRGMAMRDELIEAGATGVFDKPSALFAEATKLATAP